jgi:hypothetical protein
MPNLNYAISQQGELMFDDPINGQQAAALYDPLKQAALVPDLRKGENGMPSITLPYSDTGFEGLLSQLQAEVCGTASRTVKSSEFYWAELDQWESMAFSIAGGGSTTPGTSVATTISRFSQSQNGAFVKPIEGYNAILKEANRQLVRIGAVTKVSNGVWNITIEGINGETIDLTSKSKWTLILMPLRPYVKGDTNPIQGRGFAYNPPILYKSYITKWEDKIEIHEDEIDHYVYNREWKFMKGMDRFGRMIDYIYMPAITDQFTKNWAANRSLATLFNKRDYVRGQGFDGMIPSIEKYGMFNMSYSSLLSESFRDLLFSMIKNIRKVNGSPLYMLLHDFNFGLDWSNAMNALVKALDAGDRYKSFGDGVVGERTLEYFMFTDFSYNNYRFQAKQIDMFDSYRFGNVLEYFAMLLPGTRLKDSDGNTVPIVTYVDLEGAEPAKRKYMWFDDARVRGERTLNGFIKDSFGIEIHAPQRCGLIFKGE